MELFVLCSWNFSSGRMRHWVFWVMHCALTFVLAAILWADKCSWVHFLIHRYLGNPFMLLCSFPKCKYTKLNIFIAICCKLSVWICMKTIIHARNPWAWQPPNKPSHGKLSQDWKRWARGNSIPGLTGKWTEILAMYPQHHFLRISLLSRVKNLK